MSKHTPGPWSVARHGYGTFYEAHAFIEHSVCGIWWPDGNVEQEANARLIAAAPELLEALKRLTEGMEASGGWDGDDEDFDTAMKAIAKAEGRA